MEPIAGHPGSSLTKRELEVLELVSLGLTNNEIARQLCLSRRTVDTHVEHLLTKLHASTRTRAVVEAGRARILRVVPDRNDRLHNLPVQATSFIGRYTELSELKALMTTSRLVTIVGTGGVGKTRVALHLGAQLLQEFDDGVWFADLATMDGQAAVVNEIASALAVKSPGFCELLDHVIAHLKHKHLLLVLDNCEHVVGEAARIVDAMLANSPRVTVLATSRERLGAHGEQVYRLPSLAVPPPVQKLNVDEASRFSAIALFTARASASDSHFTMTDDNVEAVSEICRHLDGIALAIELAAARITTLHANQLVERLRTGFRLLRGDERTVHPRYQTMRAALDWSYEWLPTSEKRLFRRLGIFRGGWTLQSIYACGVDEALDEVAVLDQLRTLVGKSLVAVDFRGQSQRYRLMEPLRQYAHELLEEHGELEDTAKLHAQHFAEFARRVGSKWLQVSDLEFVATLEEEVDSIRAALEWTLVKGNDPTLGAESAFSLGGFWFTQYYHEGLRWLEAAQAAVTFETHPVVTLAIAAHRVRAYAQTNADEAIGLCEEWFDRARALGEERLLLRFLLIYGLILVSADRLDEAEVALKEALALAERIDAFRVQYALFGLARLNRKRGKLDVAYEFSRRMAGAHEQTRLPGDRNRWFILAERACAEQSDGSFDRAIELCREAYAGTQQTKDVLGGVQIEYYLGVLLLRAGSIEETREHGRRVLKISTEEFLPHGVAPALQLLAGVATSCASYELAAHLVGFAEARFSRQNLLVDVDPEWFLQPLREHFGDEALARLMAEGAAWLQERAIEEAYKV